ncbi:uncharacterized protein LOC143283403 [Babylonia areolata]|uniref:uncharacterized protein LOC143283403 n=1 Tax=Babylonia areolata TaxID=304850 RepID=UPI003FCEEB6D
MECSTSRDGDGASACSRPLVMPSWLRRWKCCNSVVSATAYVFCVLMMLTVLLPPCRAKNITVECSLLGDDLKCPTHHCCVKKVVTFQNEDVAQVGTECQPLLGEGAMCLRNTEGYMCPCLPSMVCHFRSKYDTMGYCRSRR